MKEQQQHSLVKEFEEFIAKGSVVDMAVGLVMGTAFSAIVNSLVNDLIMPLVGVVLGGVNFSSLSINVGEAAIKYGNFIQVVLNFLIIAVCVFTVVKVVNKMRRKE